MVSGTITAAMVFAIVMSVIAVAAPLCIIYLMAVKKETGMASSFGLGLLAYFWAQYLLPIPILFFLTKWEWFMNIFNSGNLYVIYLFITALVMVTLATLGRIWCVWLMNKKVPSLFCALSSAIGFTTFTAMSKVTTYWSYINYCKLINNEGIDALVQMVSANGRVTKEAAEEMANQLINANAFDICMEGFNMIFVIMVEMFLVMVIYEGFIRKKTVKATVLSGAIGVAYTFISSLIGSLSTEKMGNLVSQHTTAMLSDAFAALCGVLSIYFLLAAIRRYKKALAEGPYAHYAYFEKD